MTEVITKVVSPRIVYSRDVGPVGASYVFGVWIRAAWQHADKGLVGISGIPSRVAFCSEPLALATIVVEIPRDIGARCGLNCTMQSAEGRFFKLLFDFGKVPMLGHAVALHTLVALAVDEVFCDFPTCAADAAIAVDHDTRWLDDASLEQRHERQLHAGRDSNLGRR